MPRKRGSLADWIADAALPIVVVDRRQRVRVFNRGFAQLTGIAPGDMIGRRCEPAGDSPLEGPAAVLDACVMAAAAFQGQPTATVLTLPSADGATVSRTALLLPLEPEETEDAQLLIALAAEESVQLDAEPALIGHSLLRAAAADLQARYHFKNLLTRAPAMSKAVRQVAAAGAGTMSVLVTGQPGTGRTHVCRTIANLAQTPADFIATLDLSGIDLAAFESQVEPFVPHAGVGPAVLICEHLHRWRADVQAEFVRVLSERNATSRLLATAPPDRLERVSPALLNLVSDVQIDLARLRDRQADVRLLAQAFLEQTAAVSTRPSDKPKPIAFEEAALELLDRYSWPGNVSELQRTVIAATQKCTSDRIKATDMPLSLRTGLEADAHVPPQPIRPLAEVLEEAERTHIAGILQAAGGDKAKTAKLLGISRPKLYRRIEQLGLDSDQ